jgi:hypothetical protein
MGADAYDTEREIGDEFLEAVAGILHRHPAGVSEYELIGLLRAAGFLSFLGPPPADPQALFCAHFLLFHALYRLGDRASSARRARLEVGPLNIRWLPYGGGEGGLGRPDTMRDYYLDLSNLARTTAQEVDALIASFWRCLGGRDRRAGALAELGLADPVDDATIRLAYRRLAMAHHPDRGGDKARLQAINAAVGILLKST